uniref:Uncharacterized protein LOC108051524 n=1 Tax=Drosophila rhopaloa TaxID=1041015 RepID=A0A6P4FIK0_DRORH
MDLKLAWADPNVALFNQVLSYMDQSLEPCQNFQNYSTKYAKWIKPPTRAKFNTMLDELKDQDFEEGSLEGKLQRFYNICLARTPSPYYMEPVQRLTLQELEIQHGISLSKYIEFVFDRTVPPSAIVHVMSHEFLERFKEQIRSCAYYMTAYLQLASNLLYEERILGPAKVSQYQSQVEPIFKAIRHQIITRLERNSLNWTTSEIKDLQENLNGLTLGIGGLPNEVNHRQFVTNLYKDLNFTVEDDYDSAVLKARQVLGLKEEDELVGSLNQIKRSGNIIVVPYNLLENLAFDLESHDLFKITQLGIQFVIGIQQMILIALNIVHESYFAPKSKFTQIQPSFSTKTLKQLSFLRLAQSYHIQLTGMPINEMLNQLTKLPSFVQAFNCPNLR